MNEYMICSFIEPVIESPFIDWTAHVTVFPWFEAQPDTAAYALKSISDRWEPFAAYISGTGFFGDDGDMPVVKVESTQLGQVHQFLWQHYSSKLVYDAYAGSAYQAHVTLENVRVPLENCIDINNFSLVERTTTGKRIKEIRYL